MIIYISSIKAQRGGVRTRGEGAREKVRSLRWWSRKGRRRESVYIMKNERSRRGTDAADAEVV